jgi:hypothetical protein
LLVNLEGAGAIPPLFLSRNAKARIGIVQSGGLIMPAKSKAQQKAAGAALSAKRGETKPSELIGASRQMYDSMNEGQLDELASTKRKGKPDYAASSGRPAKKAPAKAASKAKKRPATTRGKTTNIKNKSTKADRPKKSPAKGKRRRA